MELMREEGSVREKLGHTLCIDCMFYHFTDFSRINEVMDRMHVKDSYVDINNLSLGICYKRGCVVGSYDMSCEFFKGSTMGNF